MEYKIAIDADSLINKALHRYPPVVKDDKIEESSLELAYYDFCSSVGAIKGAVFNGLHEYEKGDKVIIKIVFSPRTNFRYEIDSNYKKRRGERSMERIELTKLVMRRMPDWTEVHKNVEADDVVIKYAKEGWLVAAIDKDVINACPTSCYNYNKYQWNKPKSELQIEQWYLMQSLMGDSADDIKGVKGIGEKKAFEIVNNLEEKHFAHIIKYFDDYNHAINTMRLVRLDQWDGEKVTLWNPTIEEDLI